jgi:hypothetical protein
VHPISFLTFFLMMIIDLKWHALGEIPRCLSLKLHITLPPLTKCKMECIICMAKLLMLLHTHSDHLSLTIQLIHKMHNGTVCLKDFTLVGMTGQTVLTGCTINISGASFVLCSIQCKPVCVRPTGSTHCTLLVLPTNQPLPSAQWHTA